MVQPVLLTGSTKALPCYHVYVIMRVKDIQLSVVRVGHFFALADFCLSLYGQHVLNRDVIMTQINIGDFHNCYINIQTNKGISVTVQINSGM